MLLKNANGQLPLDASRIASIAVIGSHADVGVLSGGGSAQVSPTGGAALTLPPSCAGSSDAACRNASQIFDPSSPLAAIRAKAPNASVQFDDGTNPASAAALAHSADVAIVFAGVWTSEGMDLPDLNLPNGQDSLISAVAAANPKVVVVIESGGPVVMPWLDNVAAVLEAWYPGQKGGQAIANVLFGDVNPSGKLPITFPSRVADLPRPVIPAPVDPLSTTPFDVDYNVEGLNVGYKWYDVRGIEPLFPFGFGLSYTTFSLSNLHVMPAACPSFQVSFDVQNTGARAGAEVVQVYLGLPAGIGEPPRRLVAWKKVALQATQKQTVTISVSSADVGHPLSYWDAASSNWKNAAGDYTVYVGNSSRNLTTAGAFTVAQ